MCLSLLYFHANCKFIAFLFVNLAPAKKTPAKKESSSEDDSDEEEEKPKAKTGILIYKD